MPYSVKILADSLAPCKKRLTTFELTYPRFVHSELMTHRMFSRNSASSRAIPIEKMIDRVMEDPAMPVHWGKNQPGMQAEEELTGHELAVVQSEWINARNDAVFNARRMLAAGGHKQIVNRILEPWMWITVICSSTEYGNFFNLRCHPAAQPEIRKLAEMMAETYHQQSPKQLSAGEWHLPLVHLEDREQIEDVALLGKISAGRCARVSYLTHDGKRDHQADIDLADRLSAAGHWSPFEHVATALNLATPHGNFTGFKQYRKLFPTENRSEYRYEKESV